MSSDVMNTEERSIIIPEKVISPYAPWIKDEPEEFDDLVANDL
jgi:hypothetical protein